MLVIASSLASSLLGASCVQSLARRDVDPHSHIYIHTGSRYASVTPRSMVFMTKLGSYPRSSYAGESRSAAVRLLHVEASRHTILVGPTRGL